jgi:hypothetical protein
MSDYNITDILDFTAIGSPTRVQDAVNSILGAKSVEALEGIQSALAQSIYATDDLEDDNDLSDDDDDLDDDDFDDDDLSIDDEDIDWDTDDLDLDVDLEGLEDNE